MGKLGEIVASVDRAEHTAEKCENYFWNVGRY